MTGRLFTCVAALAVWGFGVAFAPVGVAPWTSRWNDGAEDCAAHPQPPLEVHEYDRRTFVLRENLCATWEAPFLYLLIGDRQALLIDTGDVADPRRMPLARTVVDLVSRYGRPGLHLLVVHTHRHLDHRAGDGQFAHLPNTTLVGYDLQSVQRYYRFAHWPDDTSSLDLGNRVIDVIPAPGHNETELVFYDRATGLVISGDFMLAGRLLIDDPAAELASARRVADFVRDRPVSAVLGGHIELAANGEPFAWQSTFHPDEHVLQMEKRDLLALPSALASFNGFYTRTGNFIFIDSLRILLGMIAAILAGLVLLIGGGIFWLRGRRRRAAKPLATSESA
ncbi:MAG TPA: MBL fold metallo-hydrolase [Rhizomicrobium sp.]|nr:MBL fold metallo-hydrolase [Rhizomicrobium sp.]